MVAKASKQVKNLEDSADETVESAEDIEAEEQEDEIEDEEAELPMKKKKPGIVYLSTIPPQMGVRQIRETLGAYGELGRVFLQPKDAEGQRGKGKASRSFTEGWVEFTSKRVAKRVAEVLNNTQVGGKRRSKAYETLWNIKYLPRFKWAHLNERLAYEKAMHQQRLRTEIAQAKRETNFFIQSIEKNKRLKKRKVDEPDDKDMREISQKPTDDEIRQKKKLKTAKGVANDRTGFLESLFGGKTK